MFPIRQSASGVVLFTIVAAGLAIVALSRDVAAQNASEEFSARSGSASRAALSTNSAPKTTTPKDVPFAYRACLSLAVGSGVPPTCTLPLVAFVVPADKRAVVEYVSVRCAQHGVVSLVFDTEARTGEVNAFPLPLKSSALDPTVLEGTESPRLYADPGSSIDFHVYGSAQNPADLICYWSISGTLVSP